MRLGTRPGPRTRSISWKISRTRPVMSPGLISAILAIVSSPRPLEGPVVRVLAVVVPVRECVGAASRVAPPPARAIASGFRAAPGRRADQRGPVHRLLIRVGGAEEHILPEVRSHEHQADGQPLRR